MDEKKWPLVTCIIPVYNRELYIASSIKSVQNQTYPNWKLVVVDDRSTDKTRAIAEEFSINDIRISVVTNKNKQGPAGARNQGLQYADGNYIAFLDSDDIWLPEHIENGIRALTNNPNIGWYFCDIERYQNEIKITSSYFKELTPDFYKLPKIKSTSGNYILKNEQLLEYALIKHIPVYVQASIFSKKVFNDLRFNEELFGVEDIYLLLEYIENGGSFCYTESIGLRYFIHESNISNSNNQSKDPEKNLKRSIELEKVAIYVLERFSLKGKKRRLAKLRLSNLYAWDFAFNSYLPQRKYLEAIKYQRMAIKIGPYRIEYWKTLVSTIIKLLFVRIKNKLNYLQ